VSDAPEILAEGRRPTRGEFEEWSETERSGRVVECDLEGVDLARLDLHGLVFERCAMRNTDLQSAILDGCRFVACRGPFARFVGADLTDATFSDCDFNNAIFRRARMGSTSFRGCRLTGADLIDVRSVDLGFEETTLAYAKLPGRSFRGRRLKGVDFTQADLSVCDFREATFENCSLREANLTESRFAGADLRGADIGGLRLSDAARFKNALISPEQAGGILAEFGFIVV